MATGSENKTGLDSKSGTKTPRGRRGKSGRSDDILNAALAEFSDKGFDATRMDDVAKKAGISKGTVYLYFDSKEKLFEGVIRRWVVPRVAAVESMLETHQGPVEDLLRGQVLSIYREMTGVGLSQILRLLIAEGPRFPHLVDFYFETVITRGLSVLSRTIALGVERGEFRSTLLPDYPQTVMAPAMVATIWKLLFETHQTLDVDRMFATHFDILMHGLKTDL
jgi:AcrR family transcriptional regulator